MSYAIGIDIGGTQREVGLRAAGRRRCWRSESIETSRRPARLDAARARARAAIWRPRRDRRRSRSASPRPGIAAPDGRSIWWMQGRLGEVEGLDWTSFLGRRSPSPVLNDAQAALLGEVWLGAAAGAANVDPADARHRRRRRGHGRRPAAPRPPRPGRAPRAHRLDPTARPTSSTRPAASRTRSATARSRGAAAGGSSRRSELVARLGERCRGRGGCGERSVAALAAGVASMINVLDPEVVIIGGGIARPGERCSSRLRRVTGPSSSGGRTGGAVRIVPRELGEYAGAIGAAWNAMQTPEDTDMTDRPNSILHEVPRPDRRRRAAAAGDRAGGRLVRRRRSSPGGWCTSSPRATAGSWSRRCGRGTGRSRGSTRSSSCR